MDFIYIEAPKDRDKAVDEPSTAVRMTAYGQTGSIILMCPDRNRSDPETN